MAKAYFKAARKIKMASLVAVSVMITANSPAFAQAAKPAAPNGSAATPAPAASSNNTNPSPAPAPAETAKADAPKNDEQRDRGREAAVNASREIRGLNNNQSNSRNAANGTRASQGATAARQEESQRPRTGGRTDTWSNLTEITTTPPAKADWQKHRIRPIRDIYPTFNPESINLNVDDKINAKPKRSPVIINGITN